MSNMTLPSHSHRPPFIVADVTARIRVADGRASWGTCVAPPTRFMGRLSGVAALAAGLCGCTNAASATAIPDASFDVSVCSSEAGTVPPSCPGDGSTCVIAASQDTPWAIAVDSAHVYWTTLARGSTAGSATGGSVVVAPLGGGSSTTIASGLLDPAAVTADGTNVYWADTSGALVMADVTAGGSPMTLVSGLGSINGIAVNAGGVYTNPGGNLLRVSLDGGTAQVVVADAGAGPALAADTAAVYWGSLEADGGALFSAPLDGGTAKLLASLPWAPVTIVVDDTTIFLAVYNGYVMSMPRDGGTLTTIASGLNAAYGLAVDSTYVYWTTQDAVMKAPKGGGTATIVATSLATAFVAVNDAGVYWTTLQVAPCATDPDTAGAVMKSPVSP